QKHYRLSCCGDVTHGFRYFTHCKT
ncbi:CRISPR-associated DxTHG motif protein, partial [Acinetobacter sp. YH12058]